MDTRALIAAAGAVFVADSVSAQTQTAMYHFIFTSPGAISGNGTNHIQVVHGAAVSAQVWVSFNPGVGQPAQGPGTLTGTVTGLESGGFDLAGSGSPGLGTWFPPSGASLEPPYNIFVSTSPPVVSGYSINNVIWGTGSPFPPVHPSPENPDHVWTNIFNASPINTGVINFSFPGGPGGYTNTGVWIHNPGISPWPFVGAFITQPSPGGSITIIPAPSAGALIVLTSVVGCRRRRPPARRKENVP